jgi:hypothetical protein
MQNELRRFPRATVKPFLKEVVTQLSAKLVWPNLEQSEVIDVAYKGLAVRRPGLFVTDRQQVVKVDVLFGAFGFQADAKVVWLNLELVGLQFDALPAEGHRAMMEYVDAKLIGQTLRQVGSFFVAKQENFNLWLQGAGGVNVFVWLNAQKLIARVDVEIEGQVVRFERSRPLHLHTRAQRRALLLLSQIDNEELLVEEFVRSICSRGNV